jgi:hypothetical protein
MGFNKKTKQGVKHSNTENIKGEGNPSWKGGGVDKHSLHSWINDNFERPSSCEICKIQVEVGKKFDWSNKDHKYSRLRADWQYVCRKCHIRFDAIYNPRSYDKLNGRWSLKYDQCVNCGLTKQKYKSQGLCRGCYYRKYKY